MLLTRQILPDINIIKRWIKTECENKEQNINRHVADTELIGVAVTLLARI
jgi:hypothetical protein